MLANRLLIALTVLGLVTPALAEESRTYDVYDKRSNRNGTVRETQPGQYEFFDTRGNRTGFGKTSPYGGSIELYDKHWNRTGEVRPAPGGSRGRR